MLEGRKELKILHNCRNEERTKKQQCDENSPLLRRFPLFSACLCTLLCSLQCPLLSSFSHVFLGGELERIELNPYNARTGPRKSIKIREAKRGQTLEVAALHDIKGGRGIINEVRENSRYKSRQVVSCERGRQRKG